ncbi:hypothetical protein MNBD_GAMMA12-3764 [hydrothermal vent metagenome]|uniref:Uncharacterized protein n=1 Tax=hydrothermal vent metagenome TaxID=652676 RepID=A0A3B0Y012_9ZZZZ
MVINLLSVLPDTVLGKRIITGLRADLSLVLSYLVLSCRMLLCDEFLILTLRTTKSLDIIDY